MDFVPLNVIGKCIESDETLFANMDAAIARGYPEISQAESTKGGMLLIVASGPSVNGQLETILQMNGQIEKGRKSWKKIGDGDLVPNFAPILAVKDAHDWLLDKGVVPDYALAIDPQEHRWNCFKKKHKDVHYLIASQCHANMFEHLSDQRVTVWHPYITVGQKRPPKRMLVGGGTTSGLRAISLGYVMGWRHFALFGFDSCLDGEKLRVNGTGVKNGDTIIEVCVDKDGETFYCNPAMALQAQHFQTYFDCLPGASYSVYGGGLLSAIINKRAQQEAELTKAMNAKHVPNDRVSFIHWGDKTQASWRYRADIPARAIGVPLNDLTADTLVFAKPQAHELMQIGLAKARGAHVIVDFCDDHFDWPHYAEALRLADTVTCPTEEMARRIQAHGKTAHVIPDPYEYPLRAPHVVGTRLLWYGHAVNKASLERVMPDLEGYELNVVSNFGGAVPWSYETMLIAFANADIVILPATEAYKSANRAVEAIRQGCYVVAEPHPAINDIPGIWIGNIREGIEWVRQHLPEANAQLFTAQKYVTEKYSPQTVSQMWRTVTGLPTTSAVETSTGTVGSTLIFAEVPNCNAT